MQGSMIFFEKKLYFVPGFLMPFKYPCCAFVLPPCYQSPIRTIGFPYHSHRIPITFLPKIAKIITLTIYIQSIYILFVAFSA